MADPYKDNVVLYLPMEGTRHGDTVFVDKTGKAVTRNGDTILSTAVAPPFGTTSAYFDGTGDYLSLADNDDFYFGAGAFTVEAWVRFAAMPSASVGFTFVSQWDDNGVNERAWLFQLYNNAGTYQLGWLDSANGTDVATIRRDTWAGVTTGVWYHIAAVKYQSTLLLFVNGVQLSSATSHTVTLKNSTSLVRVGAVVSSGAVTGYHNGYIKDLRITKGVARYRGNFSVSQTTTVDDDYWANVVLAIHGEGSGTTFTDVSNSAKTITTVGNTTHSTAVAPPFGMTSAYFDGTGDYLTLPNSDDYSFGTGDFTIECWVNSQTTSGTYVGAIANTGTSAVGQYHWRLGVRAASANNVGFTFQYSTGWVDIYPASAVNVNDSQWHHLAAVRRNGTITVFVDGVARISTYSAEPVGTTGRGCYVGYNAADTTYYTGYIKDLRITKGVARYTQDFTPKSRPFPDKTAIKTIAKPFDWDGPEQPRIML